MCSPKQFSTAVSQQNFKTKTKKGSKNYGISSLEAPVCPPPHPLWVIAHINLFPSEHPDDGRLLDCTLVRNLVAFALCHQLD